MKVYLIGMPGSGKSTLGRQMANALKIPFIDLDEEIVKRTSKSISKIFQDEGEVAFRKIESELLLQFSLLTDDFILATGGGAPCFHNGIDVINKSGFSIFLDVGVSHLVERLKHKTDRPLLATDFLEKQKTIQHLLETRMTCYRKAHVSIVDPDVDKLLEAFHVRMESQP